MSEPRSRPGGDPHGVDPQGPGPEGPEILRCGMVALVGRPNVGKSTLLNTLLGEKVAIVTPKPGTTRTRIHGILNRPGLQVVFVDTPGLSHGRKGGAGALARAMRRTAGAAATEAEVVLLVVEPKGPQPAVFPEDRALWRRAREARPGEVEVIVALNKADTIRPKQALLPWIDAYARGLSVDTVVPISARTGDNLDALLHEVVRRLPESPPIFPTDLHTDRVERWLCEELVREQLLLQLEAEVPHGAAVVIESFEDLRDPEAEDGGLCRLEGRVIVERESQKGIVVGRRGARIKSISQAAREEMEGLLGSKVYLRLQVRVDPHWTDDERALRRYGIES